MTCITLAGVGPAVRGRPIPRPLSGDFTQGEVWQLTHPLLSWRIGYVGDPLYNPFKAKPRVKAEDLKAHSVLKNAYEVLGK